jgi:hypothetical protein
MRETKVFSVYKDFNDRVVEKSKLAALSVCAKIVIDANEKVVTAIQTVIEDTSENVLVNIKTKIQQLIVIRNEAVEKVLKEVYDKRNKRDASTKLVEFTKGSDIFNNITDTILSGVDSQEDKSLEDKIKELESVILGLNESNVDINKVCDDYKSEILKLKEANGKLSDQVSGLQLNTIPSENANSD